MTAQEIQARIQDAGLPETPDRDAIEFLGLIVEEAGNPDALFDAAEAIGGDAGLYLRGEAHARSGEDEEALGPWLTLCDHLAQAEQWPALTRVATRALDTMDSPSAGRYLLQACEGTQDREPAKERAETLLRSLPKDPRVRLVAGRARKDKGEEGAADLYARAFETAARKGEEAIAEEAFLFLIEEDDVEALSRAGRALIRAAEDGKTQWVAGLLETGGAAFERLGLDGALIDWAVAAARKGADLEPLRGQLTEALKRAHAGRPYLPKLLVMTGIDKDTPDLRTALLRIEEVFAFPPGRYVAHHSFGVGPVLDTDGESVTIDFPKKGEKRMSIKMASKALTLLDPDDIRVQLAKEKDAIDAERKDDRVAILVRGLRHLGGEATAKQLKAALAPRVMPEKSWNAWWKKARDLALSDPRVSTSEAYREQYRLPTGDEDEDLPSLGSISDRSKALDLLKKLLKDQPDREEEARETYFPVLASWLREKLEPKVRARLLLRLDAWAPERGEQWATEIGKMFAKGLEIRVVKTADHQERLLGLGLRSDRAEDAAVQGLSSRFVTVRERAMQSLVDAGPENLLLSIRKILAGGQAGPIHQIATWYATGGKGGFGSELSPWRLVSTLMSTLATDTENKAEKVLMELFDPEGPLAARLSEVPCPEDLYGSLRMGQRSLQKHFQLSHRAKSFLEATGASAALPGHGHEEEDAAPSAALQGEELLVSRGTAHRMERRVETLKRELQTTIPEEILRAREHGDLRENAEYKAAKEKQALTTQALDELKESLQNVRFLEDLPWEDGRILPGAEIVLEGGEGDRREIWLLGDGEDYLGEKVISHRSPIGQTLIGKREGETVTLPRGGEPIEYRITSVTRRIPTREETEAGA